MRKDIFKSEDEYRKVIYRTVCVGAKINYEMSIRNAIEKELIKKSELEQSREEYYSIEGSKKLNETQIFGLLIRYKDALEKELEKKS